jgi:hypothetical protein
MVLAIKVGQQAADVEFFDSKTDDLLINGTFGWPAIFGTNLPAGGPAPPIAVPGGRVKAQLSDQVTALEPFSTVTRLDHRAKASRSYAILMGLPGGSTMTLG